MGRDFATIKYNASGVQQWVARYNGPANADDIPYAIAVDSTGNVYVTGSSLGSGTGLDYATVKYNASGAQQWVMRYDGPGHVDDIAYAMAVDGSGNVYVTGSSRGSGTALDYATVKYDAAGAQQFVKRYDGPAHADDIAYAVAVDNAGNICVTGSSLGAGTALDYATVKYNAGGTQQWVARYNGPGGDEDVARALAIDGAGNVFVTGSSLGFGTALDYATIKYDWNGAQKWVTRYKGVGGNRADIAYAIAVVAGNVFVTGSSLGSGSGLDYATVKYDSAGTRLWVMRYDGPGHVDDIAYALAVDGSANVYVTGSSLGAGTGLDYATIKYNSTGNQQWVTRYNGPAGHNDIANSIALDSSANVFVTGSSLGFGSGLDFATIKYNAGGMQQWLARFNGPAFDEDIAEYSLLPRVAAMIR